jgi:hypothetical protein
MTGAALSTVAAELVVLLVVIVRGRFLSSATLGDLARAIPAAAALAASLVATGALPAAFGIAIGAVVYGLGTVVTGAWTPEDRIVLRSAIEYLIHQRRRQV